MSYGKSPVISLNGSESETVVAANLNFIQLFVLLNRQVGAMLKVVHAFHGSEI